MATEDVFILFAELSVALAGFSGVVGALDRRNFSQWSPKRRTLFANLLAASFLALFWSVTPLILLNAGVSPSWAWGLSSTLWPLVIVPGHLMFWGAIRKHDLGTPTPAIVQSCVLTIVVGLQVYNAVSLQLAWPLLVAIVLMLGSAATAFVLIVIDRESG